MTDRKKIYCNTCKGETNHDIKSTHDQSYQEEYEDHGQTFLGYYEETEYRFLNSLKGRWCLVFAVFLITKKALIRGRYCPTDRGSLRIFANATTNPLSDGICTAAKFKFLKSNDFGSFLLFCDVGLPHPISNGQVRRPDCTSWILWWVTS